MKRRKSSGSGLGALSGPSSSWLLTISVLLLPLLLLVGTMVGGASGSAIHLMGGARNVTNRANRCPSKPLSSLQAVLLGHLRHHNSSAQTAICEHQQLFDIAVGCGSYANATVESWATSMCLASSWRGGLSQSRTRRRTSSSLLAEKHMKRINSLLAKARCKPRKQLLPVADAVNFTAAQRRDFTEMVHLEPCMVEVKRCGGCCSNELLQCSAVKTKNKKIPFLKLESSGREARSSTPSSTDMIVELTVEFHTKCKCECKTKKCTVYQIFDAETCTCRCPDGVRSCSYPQYFDPEECRCRCSARSSECSSGMVFDESTCRCEVQDMFYAEYVLL